MPHSVAMTPTPAAAVRSAAARRLLDKIAALEARRPEGIAILDDIAAELLRQAEAPTDPKA